MKLTVLMDNNTLIDRYYVGEPGVAYLIESQEVKILLDTGYSDAFIQNANKMNMDLSDIDYIVLSHGHNDHTWGLEPLMRKYIEVGFEKKFKKPPTLIAHPFVFHLLNPSGEQIKGTKDYLSTLNLRGLYPCHCTDLHSKVELAKKIDIKEVGVGLELDFDMTTDDKVIL